MYKPVPEIMKCDWTYCLALSTYSLRRLSLSHHQEGYSSNFNDCTCLQKLSSSSVGDPEDDRIRVEASYVSYSDFS